MKLCLQCTPQKKNKYVQNISKTAKWIKGNPNLHGLPLNRKSPSHPIHYPKDATIKIKIKVPIKSGKVLFWAAKARGIYNDKIKAIDAYTKDRKNKNFNYVNTGIAKIKNNYLTLKCQAPRPYFEEG